MITREELAAYNGLDKKFKEECERYCGVMKEFDEQYGYLSAFVLDELAPGTVIVRAYGYHGRYERDEYYRAFDSADLLLTDGEIREKAKAELAAEAERVKDALEEEERREYERLRAKYGNR